MNQRVIAARALRADYGIYTVGKWMGIVHQGVLAHPGLRDEALVTAAPR
jgi:hypothetical protein